MELIKWIAMIIIASASASIFWHLADIPIDIPHANTVHSKEYLKRASKVEEYIDESKD